MAGRDEFVLFAFTQKLIVGEITIGLSLKNANDD